MTVYVSSKVTDCFKITIAISAMLYLFFQQNGTLKIIDRKKNIFKLAQVRLFVSFSFTFIPKVFSKVKQ